jgi:uncharacterized protein YbjT (DUF2867 family)
MAGHDERHMGMSTVLVTGGTGTLGRAVVPALRAAGHDTFVLSRHLVDGPDGQGRRIGDLLDGRGVAQALRGIQTVVHLASSARHTRHVDVDGTRRQYEEAARAGVGHVLYMSIVGCDANPLGYYRIKAEAEKLTLNGPVPGTVVRATQFHRLAVMLAARARFGPFVVSPRGVRAQPVDVRDVAERVVADVETGAAGRVWDIAGPQTFTLADVAALIASARGRRPARAVHLPPIGGVLRSFSEGSNLAGADADRGSRTLEAWLAERVGR